MKTLKKGTLCRVSEDLKNYIEDDVTTSTGDPCYIPDTMIQWLIKEKWIIRVGEYNNYGCYDMRSKEYGESGWVVPDTYIKAVEKVFNSLE